MGWIFAPATFYLAVGISSMIISVLHPELDCGVMGHPPLIKWLFGTGISYIIIGFCNLVAGVAILSKVFPGAITRYVLGLSGAFTFAWMIVGAVSLWRDGGDCQTVNYVVWAMGTAAVSISVFIVCCVGGVAYKTANDD